MLVSCLVLPTDAVPANSIAQYCGAAYIPPLQLHTAIPILLSSSAVVLHANATGVLCRRYTRGTFSRHTKPARTRHDIVNGDVLCDYDIGKVSGILLVDTKDLGTIGGIRTSGELR